MTMKPKTDPSTDSLISGMAPQSQPAQSPFSSPSTAYTNPQSIGQYTGPASPYQTASPQAEPPPQANSYVATTPSSPFQESVIPGQPLRQTSEPIPANPIPVNLQQSPFINPVQETGYAATQAVVNPVQQVQATSPLDTPPAPPSQPQPVQNAVNLGNAVVEEKPKRKFPIFLLLLLLLVILVLGAVGYLAFQNYQLTKKTSGSSNQQPSLKAPVTADPYQGYVSYKSTILPIEFMTPSGWKTEESEDKDLANQKMIKSNSPDFAYQESEIASGFEFRVGPVNDLTKKYDSFDAFSAEENTDNLFSPKSVNGTTWLVKGNEAKTLINNSPVTIALYSNTNKSSDASDFFNKILNSIKISVTPTVTPIVTPVVTLPASPSATPLE